MTTSQLAGQRCRRMAIEKYGKAWGLLSREQQQGAIALELIFAISAAALTTPNAPGMAEHILAMSNEALNAVCA